MLMSRREAMAVLATTAALPLMHGCGRSSAPSGTNMEAETLSLLDQFADSLLNLAPESATWLGIDTGARAALRSRLTDRSAEGVQRIASQVRSDLERANAVDRSRLTYATRTSNDVVRSAYATAL